MALKYYYAEPAASSLESMIPLIERRLSSESICVDLHKFEQHSDWFAAINPEAQVPMHDHDDVTITRTTVINDQLEEVFPDVPLRLRNPVGAARLRYSNKFVDEQVMNDFSMRGWHRMIGIIARNIDGGEFEQLMARGPLRDHRSRWRTVRSAVAKALAEEDPMAPGRRTWTGHAR
jgi:glutathione S-transferase